LRVVQDGVAMPLGELVAQLMPLVETRRYKLFIAMHAPPEPITAEAIQKMRIVDPRGNMSPMFRKLWQVPLLDQKTGAHLAWSTVFRRDGTLPSLLEAYGRSVRDFRSDPRLHSQFVMDFMGTSVGCPTAKFLQVSALEKPMPETLANYEKTVGEDPASWMALSQKYSELEDFASAERCMAKSAELSPSYDSVVLLADLYRRNGKPERYRPTLEAYLEVEDLGLDHARVHDRLAEEYVAVRDWQRAEPHALAAAQTWSNWGLIMGSRVYEGLRDYEKAEFFLAEAAGSYPRSSSGADWYFLCRRVGRGQVAQARELAESNLSTAMETDSPNDAFRVFAFRVLEGEHREAILGLGRGVKNVTNDPEGWSRFWELMFAMSAAVQLDDDELIEQSIVELREIVEKHAVDARVKMVVDVICDAYAGRSRCPGVEGGGATLRDVQPGAGVALLVCVGRRAGEGRARRRRRSTASAGGVPRLSGRGGGYAGGSVARGAERRAGTAADRVCGARNQSAGGGRSGGSGGGSSGRGGGE
jgi:tetratricopeptide (TPR) repeat protein